MSGNLFTDLYDVKKICFMVQLQRMKSPRFENRLQPVLMGIVNLIICIT